MSLNHQYLIGSLVVMLGTCDVIDPLTEVETKTDPTSFTFTREKPDGTIVTYSAGDPEVAHVATGIESCTVTVDVAGVERWQYAGTGACTAVAEDAFKVLESSL